MGITALGRQFGTLAHTEPMLLVGNDHTQIFKGGTVRHQGMGADHQVDLPQFQSFPD